MLKATIGKKKLIMLGILTKTMKEATLYADDKGIKVKGFDESKTTMTSLAMNRVMFDKYELTDNFKANFNVGDFVGVVGRITADKINLELGDNIKVIGNDKEREQGFILPLMETQSEVPILELVFKKNVEMGSKEFRNTIRDMGLMSETLQIGISETDDFLIMSGNNLKQARVNIKSAKKGLMDYAKYDKSVKSTYSVDLLDNALSGSKIAKKVNVFVSDEYPLKIQFICDEKDIELETILSPRAN